VGKKNSLTSERMTLAESNMRRIKNDEDNLADTKRRGRHLLDLPIEYYLGDMKVGRPGFTVNASKEGLAVDLPEKLKVGENLKLKLLCSAQGSIEIIGKIVWMKPPARIGETHRYGVRIVQLSSENKNKLEILLSGSS
jgi:Tfp pilus assembly protein PilZ